MTSQRSFHRLQLREHAEGRGLRERPSNDVVCRDAREPFHERVPQHAAALLVNDNDPLLCARDDLRIELGRLAQHAFSGVATLFAAIQA